MTFKKFSFFCALFLCVFTSCKKNGGSSSGYHLTATIDGQSQSFNVNPFVFKVTNGGASIISIEGYAGNQSNQQIMAISWTSYSPSVILIPGNYSDTSSAYSLEGVYNPSISVSYVGGNGLTANMSNSNHLKMTITSIDSTAVKGTFSGDFYLNGDASSPKKSITSGDFYVPWKK